MRTATELYAKVSRAAPIPCKLCGAAASPFDVVDFNKFCSSDPYGYGFSGIPVYYQRCRTCECIFTTFFDDWSPADFSRFVYNGDYVLVDPDYTGARALATAELWDGRFPFTRDAHGLDFGAGAGHFAAQLNARCFQFASYDPFSSPDLPSGKFDIVTAFEVIEHSPRPLDTFEQVLSWMGDRKILIVGQSLQPDDIETVRGAWWYLAPRNGHCTLYSERSFSYLADRYGLTYVSAAGLYGFFSHPEDEISREMIARLR